jgi:hypothetical protein
MDITIELIANNKRVTLSKIIGGCFLIARKNIVPPYIFVRINPPLLYFAKDVSKNTCFSLCNNYFLQRTLNSRALSGENFLHFADRAIA